VKLRYTPRAAAELDEILEHIGSQSPQGAANVKRRVHRLTAMLLRHPEAGQKTNRPGLRRLVVHPYPYLIFYQAADDEIIIHGVRHGARRPSSMPGSAPS
jgi:toxin ParE1/3/4